jgi:hypothetical protein
LPAGRAAARAEQIGVRSQANVVSALTLPGRVLAALGGSRYPKLGISARNQLAAALSETP